MAQFLRPDSNVTQSSFTGGFAEIDESTASDTDFAYGANNTAAVLEVGLSDPSGTPGPGTTTVRYRVAKVNNGALNGAGNAVTVTAEIYQGAALISSDTARTTSGTWTSYSWNPDVSGVTDWTDVRLRFTTSSSGGSPSNRRGGAVSWAEVETPDAVGAATGTLSAQESGADVLSASGSVTDPAITGTLSAQESGADTASFSGTVAFPAISGGLTAQESGADIVSATGTVAIAGSLAAQEAGADAFASAGAVAVQGALIGVESGADSLSANGNVTTAGLNGSLSAQEGGADTLSGVGGVAVAGSLAAQESGTDAPAIGGLVLIQGGLSALETGSDVFAATSDAGEITGTMAASESTGVESGTQKRAKASTYQKFAA